MRLLICGDRNWTDGAVILSAVNYLKQTYNSDSIEVIIEGDAKGADKLSGMVAHALSIPLLVFPAPWNVYGNTAGLIRNKQMFDKGKPTKVLAFHDELGKSKGTKHMISIAHKSGIPIVHCYHVPAYLKHSIMQSYQINLDYHPL